jgi:predicted RNA-binding Zn-ribbon protein involved in translation (DUF1610 family)
MGEWIKKREGWLGQNVKREQVTPILDHPEENKEVKPVKTTVIFIKPKCPKCGNKKLRCTGIAGNVRYFKCKCGHKFKAIEQN